MFPKDPVRNAPQIISNLNKVFPIGQRASSVWPDGANRLGHAAADHRRSGGGAGVWARLRLLILAQIAAILPRRENDLVRLQMDAVGVIDFDQGTAELDATLHDSRLLKKFVLTGDMAMRLQVGGVTQLRARSRRIASRPSTRRRTFRSWNG